KGPSLYMPEVVSPMGRETDHLYMVILWIVIVIFVITEGMLVYSLFAFRDRPGHKARFFHGSTFIEVLLALFPSLILLYLTVASGSMWNDLKIKRTNDKGAVHIQVLAEQFSWNFRYPGADGVFGTADDVISVGEMALPADKTVVMHISAKDVIHSFFIPEARVKQDAVPGLLTKMWFRVDHMPVWDRATGKRVLLDTEAYNASEVALTGYEFKSEPKKGKGAFFQAADSKMIGLMDYSYARSENTPIWVVKNGAFSTVSAEPQYIRHHFEIGCAQLCGTLHYAMRGTVLALTGAEFDRWLAEQQADPTLQAKWAEIWDKYHPEFNRIL
ncbi:MAG: cytochrome c oxidase subunit II, partial [candidate division FCPU426 bacterium]